MMPTNNRPCHCLNPPATPLPTAGCSLSGAEHTPGAPSPALKPHFIPSPVLPLPGLGSAAQVFLPGRHRRSLASGGGFLHAGQTGRPRCGARLPKPPAPETLAPSSGGSGSTASWDEPGLLPQRLAAPHAESPPFNFTCKEPHQQRFPPRRGIQVPGRVNHRPTWRGADPSPAPRVCVIAST